jgi:hypothetical protein
VLYLILQPPSTFLGPYIRLEIFLSNSVQFSSMYLLDEQWTRRDMLHAGIKVYNLCIEQYFIFC